MLEAEVSKKTMDYIRKNFDCKVVRIEPNKFTKMKGLPDLMILQPNSIKLLELKTNKGKLSQFQKNVLKYIGNEKSDVVYGYDEEFLNEFMKRGENNE